MILTSETCLNYQFFEHFLTEISSQNSSGFSSQNSSQNCSIELGPRAGRSGTAFTLVSPHDVALVEAIEALTKTKLREHEEVDDQHVAEILTQVRIRGNQVAL